MLSNLLIVFHGIFSLLIIVLVLMQKEKGSGMIAMGGASQTLFGSQGSGSFMTKLISVIAFLFFATILGINFFDSHNNRNIEPLLAEPQHSQPVSSDPSTMA